MDNKQIYTSIFQIICNTDCLTQPLCRLHFTPDRNVEMFNIDNFNVKYNPNLSNNYINYYLRYLSAKIALISLTKLNDDHIYDPIVYDSYIQTLHINEYLDKQRAQKYHMDYPELNNINTFIIPLSQININNKIVSDIGRVPIKLNNDTKWSFVNLIYAYYKHHYFKEHIKIPINIETLFENISKDKLNYNLIYNLFGYDSWEELKNITKEDFIELLESFLASNSFLSIIERLNILVNVHQFRLWIFDNNSYLKWGSNHIELLNIY